MKLPEHINTLMPASLESERGMLCSFGIDPQTVGAMMEERGIGPDHFTTPLHSTLCERLQARWREGRPVTMRLAMKDMEDGKEGELYTSEILTHISTASYAEEYADALVDKFHLRKIIVATSALHEEAWAPLAESEPLLKSIADLAAISAPPAPAKNFKQLLTEKLDRMHRGEPRLDIIPTGIARLDEDSPLRLGDMPLISGERKAGKSIFAISIVSNVILRGETAAIFSLEDTSAKVIDRVFAGVSRVPIIQHCLTGTSEYASGRMTTAFQLLMSKQLHIRDDVHDIGPMCAVIRQLKSRDPKFILAAVDYAQLVRARTVKGANREQEVAAVSRALRLLAMELHIAILVLCQLNKDGDTRESKALEQDATAMWKIVKLPEKISKNGTTGEDEDDNANKRMLAIPFQRNGESNIAFPVSFFGHIARVENCSDERQ